MTNLLKIKEKIIKETQPVWHEAIVKELGVDTLEIVGSKSKYGEHTNNLAVK